MRMRRSRWGWQAASVGVRRRAAEMVQRVSGLAAVLSGRRVSGISQDRAAAYPSASARFERAGGTYDGREKKEELDA